MAGTGLLVVDWPFVLGCDTSGIVVKAGSKAVGPLGPLKVGDAVCGCTRLGCKGHSACEEYLLMDARVTIPKPKNIDLAQATTVGVGFDTACLGVFGGLGVEIPKDLSQLPAPHGEWALVFGGSSSVGKYAVQLLKALGFNVASSCSASSSALLHDLGSSFTIDYKKPQEEQLNELMSKSGGKVYRIFDAAAQSHEFAQAIFAKVAEDGKKMYFTTTNDWDPMEDSSFHGAVVHHIALGPIGRPEATKLDAEIEASIPLMVKLIEDGKVKVSDYEIKGHGFDEVASAWEYQSSGKAGNKKVLVKLGDA